MLASCSSKATALDCKSIQASVGHVASHTAAGGQKTKAVHIDSYPNSEEDYSDTEDEGKEGYKKGVYCSYYWRIMSTFCSLSCGVAPCTCFLSHRSGIQCCLLVSHRAAGLVRECLSLTTARTVQGLIWASPVNNALLGRLLPHSDHAHA